MSKIRYIDRGYDAIVDTYLLFDDALRRIHEDASVFWDRDTASLVLPSVRQVEKLGGVSSGQFFYGLVVLSDGSSVIFGMWPEGLSWRHISINP